MIERNIFQAALEPLCYNGAVSTDAFRQAAISGFVGGKYLQFFHAVDIFHCLNADVRKRLIKFVHFFHLNDNHKNTDKNKQNDRNQHDTGYPDVQYHQQDFHTQRYSEAGNNLWNVMGVKCLQLFHIVHNDRFDLPGCRCFHIAHW